MERFRPDSVWEGLLRPILMADPEGGLYLEVAAPDLRFLMLLAVLSLLLVSRRLRQLTPIQTRALLSLFLCVYLWTFSSGNGRYFIPGLVLVGPLLVVGLCALPGSRSLIAFLLLLCVALQTAVTASFFRQAPWAIAWVKDGVNLPIIDSEHRTKPAVFFSLGGNSHSALVPLFGPGARWTNVAGHYRPIVGGREHAKLQELLNSELPKYAVVPKKIAASTEARQPTEHTRASIESLFRPVGLTLLPKPCEVLTFKSTANGREQQSVAYGDIAGFWLCPVDRSVVPDARNTVALPERYKVVLEAIENSCPRFFPSGGGLDEYANDVFVRHYSGSDTQLRIHPDESVYYGYYRTFAATRIGKLDDIASNRISVPCSKLAGRYQVPWLRE